MNSRNRRNVSRPIDRKSKRPVRRKRTYTPRFTRLVTILIVALIVVAGGFGLYKLLQADNYSDKDSFIRYADNNFDKYSTDKELGKDLKNYKYGQPVSTAANYPKIGDKDLDEKIKSYIDNERAEFEGKYDDRAKDEKFAQITTYDSVKSNRNTSGVVLKTVELKENDDGEFYVINSKVKTFNFNSKNKSEIYQAIAFKPGYKENLSKILPKAIKDEIDDNGKNNPVGQAENSNFLSEYIIKDDQLTFFITAKNLKDLKEPIVEVSVKGKDLKKVLKDKINERNIDPRKPMVALTFDDGPKMGTTNKILDTLEKYNAVATFFEVGSNVQFVKESRELLKREEKLGCEVASHSYSHPNLFTLSDKQILEDNRKADAAFKKAVGHTPTLYRPPYGNGDERISKLIKKAGINWSVDTLDWQSKNTDSIVNIVKNVKNLDGRVILMHSIYDFSVRATEQLVPWLKKEGYQFVTVSEMLAYKYHQDPSEIKFYGYNYFYPEEHI